MWQLIHDQLRVCMRRKAVENPSSTAAIMDYQSVKMDNQAGWQGYDASKKVLGRKWHLLLDTLGLILGLFITPARVQDRKEAKGLPKPLNYALGAC
jgi:hypothetical protein